MLSFKRLEKKLQEEKESFSSATPFPYIVVDDFLPIEIAKEGVESFPSVEDNGWIHYIHYNEKKHGLNKKELLPVFFQNLINELNKESFLIYLRQLTGIKNLIADPYLEGGGLHQSHQGGFLNIHADFTVHPHKKNWSRRVNLLIYFNEDWKEEYLGSLEFWDKKMITCVQKIDPLFNRCVIFKTDSDSFHGFPDPIQFPEGTSRKSLALYYFTEEDEPQPRKATNYQARPSDGINRIWIYLDKQLLNWYNKLKGWLGINDDLVSKILKLFSRK